MPSPLEPGSLGRVLMTRKGEAGIPPVLAEHVLSPYIGRQGDGIPPVTRTAALG